ncbi:hypothetical protein HK405_016043 [Cladochytrium tenue]|nr:hypothetical protein HK405_016043 [Cladochytrium tenue]
MVWLTFWYCQRYFLYNSTQQTISEEEFNTIMRRLGENLLVTETFFVLAGRFIILRQANFINFLVSDLMSSGFQVGSRVAMAWFYRRQLVRSFRAVSAAAAAEATTKADEDDETATSEEPLAPPITDEREAGAADPSELPTTTAKGVGYSLADLPIVNMAQSSEAVAGRSADVVAARDEMSGGMVSRERTTLAVLEPPWKSQRLSVGRASWMGGLDRAASDDKIQGIRGPMAEHLVLSMSGTLTVTSQDGPGAAGGDEESTRWQGRRDLAAWRRRRLTTFRREQSVLLAVEQLSAWVSRAGALVCTAAFVVYAPWATCNGSLALREMAVRGAVTFAICGACELVCMWATHYLVDVDAGVLAKVRLLTGRLAFIGVVLSMTLSAFIAVIIAAEANLLGPPSSCFSPGRK